MHLTNGTQHVHVAQPGYLVYHEDRAQGGIYLQQPHLVTPHQQQPANSKWRKRQLRSSFTLHSLFAGRMLAGETPRFCEPPAKLKWRNETSKKLAAFHWKMDYQICQNENKKEPSEKNCTSGSATAKFLSGIASQNQTSARHIHFPLVQALIAFNKINRHWQASFLGNVYRLSGGLARKTLGKL